MDTWVSRGPSISKNPLNAESETFIMNDYRNSSPPIPHDPRLIEKLKSFDMKETRRWKAFEILTQRAVREGRNYVILRCEKDELPECYPSPFIMFLESEGFSYIRRKSDRTCWDFEIKVHW